MVETGWSEATERVLDIAERLLMVKGYAATSLRDIAEAAGIRQASLYYHFPEGKEQLYVAVVERVFNRHRLGMEQAVADAPSHLYGQLQAIADWFGNQPPVNFLGMMYADLPALSPAGVRRVSQSAFRTMFGPLRTLFAEAAARGEARPHNPDLMAGFYVALLDGITFSLTQQQHVPRALLTDAAVSLMLYGIAARTEPSDGTTPLAAEGGVE